MNALRSQTQLVEFDPARAGVIGTVVDRAEFAETAARGEFPATFLLDLDRVEADGDEVTAHLALEWDRDTLDRLLSSTSDPELTLWFDESELARAFDDVEAHSLKQKAALIAVAVTAAGASATPAFARIAPDVGGMGTAQMAGNTATHTTGQSGAVPQLTRDQQIANAQVQSSAAGTSEATSSGGSGVSSSELAAIAGVGAVLISAAGFGVARKRTHTVQPA